MQFVVLLLLVVALALLVLGLVGTSTPLVIASIVVSLVAVYAAVRARSMRDARLARRATEKAQAERTAADRADADRALAAASMAPARAVQNAQAPPVARTVAEPSTTVLPRVHEKVTPAEPVPSDLDNAAFGYVGADLAVESLHLPVAEPDPVVEPDPVTPRHAVADEATTVLPAVPAAKPAVAATELAVPATEPAGPTDPAPDSDEPPSAGTTAPLDVSGDERVWVVDGRPRYHWKSCAFLDFRESEPITLKQAVEDGFTPCALCDPDTRLAF